jgi:co-chaperonin GroES (HSP10)
MAKTIFDVLVSKIEADIASAQDFLEAGSAKDYAGYKEVVGLVVDMGDGAYKDKERFPDGAWCKEGDFVMFRANSGTRFKVAGKEYRLLNDDSIEAVVADPRGITRA